MSGKTVKEYQKGLKKNMVGFTDELTKVFPDLQVTSSFRPRAFTKQGAVSRHAKGEAVDIAPDKRVYEYLWNTKEGLSLLNKYNLGVLDETTPEMLAKTDGTGAHYHIGMDSTVVSKARDRYRVLVGSQVEDTNTLDYFENPINNANFASVPDSPDSPEETVKEPSENLKNLQEKAFIEEYKSLYPQQERTVQQEQAPQPMVQSDVMGIFNDVSNFIDTPIAQQGKIIKDNMGQWNHPGKVTQISSPDITMKGVNYSVLGVADTGETKMMSPNQDYHFKNAKTVTEYPQLTEQEKAFLGEISPRYAQQGSTIEIDRGDGKIEQINIYSEEYKKMYENGQIMGYASNGMPHEDLNEVVLTDYAIPKDRLDTSNFKIKDERYEALTVKDNTPTFNKNNTKEENFEFTEDKLKKTIEEKRKELSTKRLDLNPKSEITENISFNDLKGKESIIKVQQRLQNLGYNLDPKGKFTNKGVDGLAGAVTIEAIKDYNSKKESGKYTPYKNKEGLLGNCKEEQCSEYSQNEIFRNFKPNVTREVWNKATGLFGDAWTIGKNVEAAGGAKVESVKEGDIVTMYTGGFSSYLSQAKKAGTDATHVGIVDKVNPDGSYYILQNVHEGGKGNYQGKEYRSLVKEGKTQDMGFSIREKYRPAYGKVKEFEKQNVIREDVKMTVPKNKVKLLTNLASGNVLAGRIEGNVNTFLQSINNTANKKVLTSKHALDESEYQAISKLALGILAQETKLGVSDKFQIKTPGAYLAKTVGLKKDEVSKGAGQIKYETNYGKSDLTELGITESNFNDNDKTALVIIDILASNYKKLKGKEGTEKALYKSIEKYNKGHNTKYSDSYDSDYANKVVLYSDIFDVNDDKNNTYATPIDKIILEKNIQMRRL